MCDMRCILSVLAREKIKQVGKSEHQSILVVATHSCYHIKENTGLRRRFSFPDPLYCFGQIMEVCVSPLSVVQAPYYVKKAELGHSHYYLG